MDQEKFRDVNIFRSLIKQLAVPKTGKAIHQEILAKYNERQQGGNLEDLLSIQEVEDILPKLINSYSKVTIAIDALDECNDSTRNRLLSTFRNLQASTQTLKIFISSRPEGIRNKLPEKKFAVDVTPGKNRDDISKFIKSEIAKALDLKVEAAKLIEKKENEDKVCKSILSKSAGM
jgi:hypothetical protein